MATRTCRCPYVWSLWRRYLGGEDFDSTIATYFAEQCVSLFNFCRLMGLTLRVASRRRREWMSRMMLSLFTGYGYDTTFRCYFPRWAAASWHIHRFSLCAYRA